MSSIQITTRGSVKSPLTFGELDEGAFFTTINETGIWFIKTNILSLGIDKPIAVRLSSGYGTPIDEGVKIIPLSPDQIIEITNNEVR